MLLELLIFALTTVVVYFYYNYKRLERYFEEKNVKYLPGLPAFGNCWRSTLQKAHFIDDIDRVYKAFPDERYVGFIENTKPIIIIKDPELIRLITVKDFDHFTDHKDFFSDHFDPLFAGNVFMMKGEKWREMRTTLSPSFTASKMKFMVQFMVDISKNIQEYLREHKDEVIDVDDLMRRYTNDVIAYTNFGFEVNSLKDKDNEFFRIGQTVLTFNLKQLLSWFLDEQFPIVTKKLGVKLYPKHTYEFFKDIVTKAIEYRKNHKVQRPDMLQLLIDTPRDWTIEELCSQVFIFFAAGFDTTASVLVLSIHELAINPSIQEKLYQEIRAFKEANGDITNDYINSLKYLDGVLNETLRKWSPALIVDRKCVKTYELPPAREGGKPCILNPGDLVYNSCNSIHMDPKYWPDPLKYDPDRWSDENKHNITPFTYQPFGLGPRYCIGSRFAILKVKVMLFYLVLNFKILKCPKTSDPIKLNNFGFNIRVLGGTWAKFEERT